MNGVARAGALPAATVALAIGGVASAFVAGAVRIGSPLLALGLLVGGAVLAVLIFHPLAAAAVLVAVEASNVSTIVGLHNGFSVYLVALAVAVSSLVLGVVRGVVRFAWSPVFLFFALYVAARAVSMMFADRVPLAVDAVREDAKLLVYLVVMTTLLTSVLGRPGSGRTVDGPATTTKVLVLVIAILGALSLVQEFVFHNSTDFGGFSQVPIGEDLGGTTARHSGPYFEADVVGWGKAQVLLLPLALSLWAARGGGRTRWLWALAAVMVVGGIYLTQSRGAYLALGFAVVVWLLAAGRSYARLLRFAPVVLGLVLLVPGVGSRLATLAALEEATAGGGGDVSLVERVAVQREAVSMFAQHPSVGVGPGNFLAAQPDFHRESGLVTARPLLVHNSYLQVAAEGGLICLIAWLLFFGCAAFVAYRALVLNRRLMSATGRWLAVGVLGGLAGFALATTFVPLNQVRTLLSVVALGAALDIVARRTAGFRERDGRLAAPEGRDPLSWRRIIRTPLVGAAGALLVTLAVGLVAVPLRAAPIWVADATAEVVPRVQDRSAANAYEYDLISRGTLVPTYAGILADPRFQQAPSDAVSAADWVSVSPSPTAALITVSAGSRDRTVAEHTAREVMRRGQEYVESLNNRYVVTPVPTPDQAARQVAALDKGRVAAVVVLSAVVGVTVFVLLRGRRWLLRARRRPVPSLGGGK